MKAGLRNLLFILPVLLFVTLAAYFAIALRPGNDPRELPSALLNKEAPQFTLAGLNGAGIARDGLKGGPVLINFFASWCVPCRVEHPLLMRLAERDHVPLYGIDYKDQPDAARKLLAQLGDPYRAIGQDSDGRTGLDFGVYGVPETYVVDGRGFIRKRFVGPLTAQQVDRELLPLLKELGRP
jgi:cytochrome c biogenesis protein CcmG/thiol:disulfide interchange protein DsbE